MKLLVCISKTPDTTARIAFTDNNTRYDSNGVTFIMNPYDEWYALVRALELVEQSGGTVSVIHVGDAGSDQTIRKALAIGAHDAIRVDTLPQSAWQVAAQVAAVAKNGQYDLIFTGKETIDYNGSEVGALLAGLLDLPFISNASKLDMDGNTATLERDIEGGVEVLRVPTPFVVSAAKGIAEQRIPNMMGIMKAKSKPFQVVQPTAAEGLVETVRFDLPPDKTGVRLVDPENMDELVRLLHEEAKVI